MTSSCDHPATISIDLKKYRIRIHKAMLHLMGDPKYIQLLVNPDSGIVVIRSVPRDVPGNLSHKVNLSTLQSGNSIELYSRTFTTLLCSVVGVLDTGILYRMSGKVVPSQGLAVFYMSTLKQIEV